MTNATIVVIGDRLVPSAVLKEAALQLQVADAIEVIELTWCPHLSKEAFQEQITRIETQGPEAVTPPAGVLEVMSAADYLLVHLAPVTKEMLIAAPHLKLIGTCRGGLEHIDLTTVKQKQIPLLHVIRNAEPVADFTLALILAETRNIARGHKAITTDGWRKSFVNDHCKTHLRNLTVGLLGLGYIGKLIADKLHALGIQVIAYDPYIDFEAAAQQMGWSITPVSLEELFKTADVVSLHLRATEATNQLITLELLEQMKPTAYFINTARASIVEKAALLQVLQKKQIAGAALDVFWDEPLPVTDPFTQLDNVTLTPHIAGDTIDAIPNSPFLLRDVINAYVQTGHSDMLIDFS